VLIHKTPDDAAAAGEALKFFAWAYKDGKETAKALDYVSIPDGVVEQIKATWKADIQTDGKPVYAGE
jgi:phosphate transport system substrate-binding protein